MSKKEKSGKRVSEKKKAASACQRKKSGKRVSKKKEREARAKEKKSGKRVRKKQERQARDTCITSQRSRKTLKYEPLQNFFTSL